MYQLVLCCRRRWWQICSSSSSSKSISFIRYIWGRQTVDLSVLKRLREGVSLVADNNKGTCRRRNLEANIFWRKVVLRRSGRRESKWHTNHKWTEMGTRKKPHRRRHACRRRRRLASLKQVMWVGPKRPLFCSTFTDLDWRNNQAAAAEPTTRKALAIHKVERGSWTTTMCMFLVKLRKRTTVLQYL